MQENVIDPLLDYSLPPKVEPPSKKRRKVIVSEIVKPEYPGIVAYAKEGDAAQEDDEKMEKKEKVGREVLRAIFEEGGKATTNEVNRRRLYMICRAREEGGVEL